MNNANRQLTGKLYGLGHYHQAPGRHPNSIQIPAQMEIIELVTYGRGWVRMQGDEWAEVLPGTLLWHVGGDYTIGRSDFEAPYHCLAVRFGGPRRRAGVRPAPHMTQWSDLEAVRTFTNEVVSWHAMERICPQTVLSYILARVHFQIEQYQSSETRRSIPQQLQRVLQHIDRSYGTNLTLSELAQIAQWSVPQLHKSFREHLRQSPHQWLLQRRIEAARERLANSGEPIKRIAADCGFYSAAAFCAHFKRASAVTPNTYRRQMTHS